MQFSQKPQRRYDGWMLLTCLIIAGLLLFFYQALAPFKHSAQPVTQIYYYIDQPGQFTAEHAFASSGINWQPAQMPVSMGMHPDTYWFRFTLDASVLDSERPLLNISYPLLDDVRVFIYRQGAAQRLAHYHGGDLNAFADRAIKVPALVFALPQQKQPVEVLVRVKTSGAIKLPVQVWTENDYIAFTATDNLLMGLFLGLLLAMGLSNLFLFVTTGSLTFFMYAGYVFSLAMTIGTMHGLGYAYIWPEWVWLQGKAVAIFANSTIMFAMLFANRLLRVWTHSLKASWLLKGLAVVFAISMGLSFILPYALLIKVFLILLSATVMLALSISFWIALRGDAIARYYSFAWFILLGSAFAASLDNLGLISSPISSNYMLMLGAGVETTLLALILAISYNNNREQIQAVQAQALEQESAILKARAELFDVQQKHQEELEYEVQERTLELEIALRELSEANKELENLNTIDPLTGLRNRRHFDKRLLAESRRSRREQTPLSLAILDVDHFKKINDTHGHSIGDACLVHIARVLQSTIKRPADDICRFGGEEFVILLPNTELEGAQQVIETIRQNISSHEVEIDTLRLNMTISAGIATQVVEHESQADALFNAADALLYEAKNAGRNQIKAAMITG